MMLALLLAAQPAPAALRTAPVEQASLLQAFRNLCLTPAAKTGALAAPAAAAGFKPAAVRSTHIAWEEVEAWQRGGIRLFRMTDPREPHPRPMCGVSAHVDLPDTDGGLIDSVYALTDIVFGEGHLAHGLSNWTLAQRRGTLSIDIDRTHTSDVRVTLIAYPRLL